MLLAVSFALLPLLTPDTPAYRSATAAASSSPALYALGPAARAWSGALLLAACASYCIGLWSGGRRTLPMATWGLALITATGGAVRLPRASLRFLACGIGPALALAAAVRLLPVGFGRWAFGLLAVNYAWALFDGDRQFLQDRIAGTRLIVRTAPRG